MNELSLFSGAGGGLLGTMLLGFRPIGYVEIDDYCQRVLAARIKDGILPDAPIFGDIKTFISEGFAESYQGMVDVITAGFPCQPFSVAGKQKGADDERNMWPATADVIGIVRPRFVLLENVPGIRRYLPVVVRDLRRLGYEVSRPLVVGADDVGAPHRRKRIWILAYSIMCADSGWRGQDRKEDSIPGINRPEICCGESGRASYLADSTGGKSGESPESEGRQDIGRGSQEINVANTKTKGLEGQDAERDPCTDGRPLQQLGCNRWPVEPDVGRVANGVANRVDRLKSIGNGQVPAVVATAWRILTS